jgi:hypothetical protein
VWSIHSLKEPRVCGVEGRQYEVSLREVCSNFRHPQQRSIREHGYRNGRDPLECRDELPDPRVEGRLSRSGKPDIVRGRFSGQLACYLLEDLVQRDVLLARDGLVCRPPQLAVDAVIGSEGLIYHRTARVAATGIGALDL